MYLHVPNKKNTWLYYRKLNYYRKLYFTTENFTLLPKTLLDEKFFSTKLETIKIPFSVQKLTFFFILILIDVLEYE